MITVLQRPLGFILSDESDPTPPEPSNWILSEGLWDDTGEWEDTEVWID